MSKRTFLVVSLVIIGTITGSVFVARRADAARQRAEKALSEIKMRGDGTDPKPATLETKPGAMNDMPAATTTTSPTTTAPAPSAPSPEETEASPPAGPVLTNALRDVVVTVDRCTLATRTLRCTFVVVNQSPAEKKFVLGVGGTNSRFEADNGGAIVFDDVGNDFLSVGGGVANHDVANCDAWNACEVEKTLTANVKTSGWLRFDAVDPRAAAVKLLRLKWSDGDMWVPMDFRNVPLVRDETASPSSR